MQPRRLSGLDNLLARADAALRVLAQGEPVAERPSPAGAAPEAELAEDEREHAARLMRVNHAGEVAAQALYHGQAATARLGAVREDMERAAQEESDHLAWCAERVGELGGETSLLNPLWYLGSFTIGAIAGLAGDKWSLGFVAETERQVVAHLEGHLGQLPETDVRSRRILEQMTEDEAHHRHQALEAGGTELPAPVKGLMSAVARIMTRTAYWI